MDTSKAYIEMCRKAKEVQAYVEIHLESLAPVFIYDELSDKVCIYMWFSKKLRYTYIPKNIEGEGIWLLRQDQLQIMVGAENWNLIEKFYTFYHSLYIELKSADLCFTSMEQLWLAFVMSECYRKIWDGIDWIEKR